MSEPNTDWKDPEHGQCVASGVEDGKAFIDLYDANEKVIVRYVESKIIQPPVIFMVPGNSRN